MQHRYFKRSVSRTNPSLIDIPVAILTQLVGSLYVSLAEPAEPSVAGRHEIGGIITATGAGTQVACITIFIAMTARFSHISGLYEANFNRRIEPSTRDEYCIIDKQLRPLKPTWRALLKTIMASSWLILVWLPTFERLYAFKRVLTDHVGSFNLPLLHCRAWSTRVSCPARMVVSIEPSQLTSSLLMFSSFYVLDAGAIFPCIAMFTYWHPAQYLPYLGFHLPTGPRPGVNGLLPCQPGYETNSVNVAC